MGCNLKRGNFMAINLIQPNLSPHLASVQPINFSLLYLFNSELPLLHLFNPHPTLSGFFSTHTSLSCIFSTHRPTPSCILLTHEPYTLLQILNPTLCSFLNVFNPIFSTHPPQSSTFQPKPFQNSHVYVYNIYECTMYMYMCSTCTYCP